MHVQKTFLTPTRTLNVRTPSCMRKGNYSADSHMISPA